MHSTNTAFIAGHKAKGYVKVFKKNPFNSSRQGLANFLKSRAQIILILLHLYHQSNLDYKYVDNRG